MLFSETRWLRTNVKKLDTQLRKEILKFYKHGRRTPCYLHKIINRFREFFRKVNVIVEYEDINILESKNFKKLLGTKSIKKGTLKTLKASSARLSPRKIQRLLEEDNVKGIYLDRKYKALLDIAAPTMGARNAWESKLTGKGITTAVIDTGIAPHEDLVKPKNRIVSFKDFINNKTKPYDDNGHGTHVAGDIAGNGYSSDSLYRAPAYESLLVGVKVLDKSGMGFLSKIIAGVEWCVENKDRYNIRVICMSLGSEAVTSYKDDLLCKAVEMAWNAGIVVCVAAGNEGPDPSTISSPGTDPLIITVGASDDRNSLESDGDTVAPFSSRGPTIDSLDKPDVLCPGVDIISLKTRCSYMNTRSPVDNNKYTSLSGTSMATPLCCSCVALLLEKNPKLTSKQVKDTLMKNTIDLGYSKYAQGTGMVNIVDLLSLKAAKVETEANKPEDNKPEAKDTKAETSSFSIEITNPEDSPYL